MTARRSIMALAILCAVGFAIANAAFYVLSASYFESHHEIVGAAKVATYSPAQASHIRVGFAAVSAVVAAASFAAGVSRRAFPHVLAALLGAGSLIAGIEAFRRDLSGALSATLLIGGGVTLALAWQSYQHRVRGAWAFLVALCGVFAVTTLFGAPKIRGALDVGLWTTMLIPGLFAVACASLALLREDYVERRPA